MQFGRIAVHILIKFRASIYIALTFTAPYLTNAFDGTFVGMATVTTKCALSTTRTTTFAVPGHGQVSVEFVFSVSNKK